MSSDNSTTKEGDVASRTPDIAAQTLAEFEAGVTTKIRTLLLQQQSYQKSLEEREQQIAAREAAVVKLTTELQARAADLAAEKSAIQQLEAELEEKQVRSEEDLERLRAELQSRDESLQSSEAKLKGLQATLGQQAEEVAQSQADLAAMRESIRVDAERVRNELESGDARVRSLNETSTREREELREERRQLDTAKGQLDELRSSLEERSRALEGQTQARELAVTRGQAEVDGKQAAINADSAKLQADQAGLATREREFALRLGDLEAREKAHASLKQEVEQLKGVVSGLRDQAARAGTESTGAQVGRESALVGVIEEYEQWLRCDREAWASLRVQLDEAKLETAEASAVIEALKGKVRQLLSEQSKLKDQSTSAAATDVRRGHSETSLRSERWVAKRRERLVRVRSALRARKIKLDRAGAAMTKRFEQCEKILSQRANLAIAHQRVRDGEQKLRNHNARSNAAIIGFCVVAMLGILGLLSWAVAREFAPATFEAQAMLGADAKDRKLNDGELAEWQRFHETLLMDPIFHETAAERFKRNNVEKLMTPGQVNEWIQQSVTTESLQDGQLMLRLKGQGGDATARLLDTLTSAFASHANTLASRRIDGASTRVISPAEAGDAPIDRSRNLWMLVGFAASSVIGLGLVGVTYSRLAHAKHKLERDDIIAANLAEPGWVDPRSIPD